MLGASKCEWIQCQNEGCIWVQLAEDQRGLCNVEVQVPHRSSIIDRESVTWYFSSLSPSSSWPANKEYPKDQQHENLQQENTVAFVVNELLRAPLDQQRECPRCQQWFAKRWNGSDNHLRFCLKRPSSPAKTHAEYVPSPNISKSLSTTGDSSSGCSGSDPDGSETSDMDSNATPNPLIWWIGFFARQAYEGGSGRI